MSTRGNFIEARRLHRLDRWLYRGGRPNLLARLMNRISAIHFASGVLAPSNWVTLEVPGRRTGRIISFPVVVADYEGERYLVSMLGQHSNWVRNVRAAGGRVTLRHGRREGVRLEEVEVGDRAPILRRYLECAPGARPHMPVARRAPLEEFDRIAGQFPVFRITADRSAPSDSDGGTLADFLVARGLEVLDAEPCKYERLDDGRVVAEGDVPTERARRTLEWIEFVRWCDANGADSVLRLLGDVYAAHPDYKPEWHRIGSTS